MKNSKTHFRESFSQHLAKRGHCYCNFKFLRAQKNQKMFESIYFTCVSLRCNMNRKGKPNDKSNLFSLPNAPCSIPSQKREKKQKFKWLYSKKSKNKRKRQYYEISFTNTDKSNIEFENKCITYFMVSNMMFQPIFLKPVLWWILEIQS